MAPHGAIVCDVAPGIHLASFPPSPMGLEVVFPICYKWGEEELLVGDGRKKKVCSSTREVSRRA